MSTLLVQDVVLSERDFRKISDMVYKHCGINLHDGKKELVRARLAKRLRLGNFRTFPEYMKHVMADKTGKEFSTLIDSRVNFKNPPAWSTSFTKEDRIKAWLMANLETYTLPIIFWGNLRYFPSNMLRLFKLARRYDLQKSFLIYATGFAFHKIQLVLRNHWRVYLLQKRKGRL